MPRTLSPYMIPLSRAGGAAARCRLCGTPTHSPAWASPLGTGLYCSERHATAAQFTDRCMLPTAYDRAMRDGRAPR